MDEALCTLLSAGTLDHFLAVATLPASPQACATEYTFNEYRNGMKEGGAPVG